LKKQHFLYRFICAFQLLAVGQQLAFGQLNPTYQLNAVLIDSLNQIQIDQVITFENLTEQKIDTLFLNDWINAYSAYNTPLSKRFAEEFDRSFYLSNKKNFGYTTLQHITTSSDTLKGFRIENQQDLIAIPLLESALPGEKKSIKLRYLIKIPNARFTGYGVNPVKKTIDLRHWIITLSPYSKTGWKKYSNLNLDDASLEFSDYQIQLSVPASYTLVSNLHIKNQAKGPLALQKTYLLSGQNIHEVKLVLEQQKTFSTAILKDGFSIATDLKEPENTQENFERSLQKIYDFLASQLGQSTHPKLLVTQKDYNKSPFYGLSQLPEILSPFDVVFLNEVKLLKTISGEYIKSNLSMDQRKNHWLSEGLHVYLTMKYIETYYPEKKFIGRLSRFPIVKSYQFAKIGFNQGFMLLSEQMLRLNNYQKATLSKDQLTRYNARIANPYTAGLALRYLEDYIGSQSMEQLLLDLFDHSQSAATQDYFQQYSNKNLDWFFKNLLDTDAVLDYALSKPEVRSDGFKITLSDKFNSSIPVKINLLKGDSIVYNRWVMPSEEYTLFLPKYDADYVAINAQNGLPELNKKNNWRKINPGPIAESFQFRALKDIENPKKIQVFFNPINSYNLYDGITSGIRFNNKKIGAQRFSMDIKPEYSFLENTVVGSFSGTYRWYRPKSKNYLTLFNVSGNSFHYANNKRYNVIAPNVSLLFRTPDLRSNIRKLLNFSIYRVEKQEQVLGEGNPEYTVFKTRYLYTDNQTINYITSDLGIEFSTHFSKMDYTADFRRLFPSGRQFQARVFAGYFISSRTGSQSYFDFNLNRPTDYLFELPFFGRSETSGFFGQQFVMAEGGFKSIIPNSNANKWLLSTNLSMGLWRWVEAYLDLGLLKNQKHPIRSFYDTGLRLNILPDYLEAYFPIASTMGWEVTQINYHEKIRFVLSIRPKQLANLFSRRWF